MASNRSEFFAGVKAQLPILLGTTPFGMIFGILAMEADLPPAAALGMSMFVFAGSSQFIAAQLFAEGAPGPIVVLTTFIVNLRHMLYSASVAPYVKHLSPIWKYLLAFLLTDEAYALSITHYRTGGPAAARDTNQHWYFLGAGLALWVSWQASTAAGVFLGAQVPSGWSLDFTLPLTFIALVIPTLTDRPAVIGALSAGLVAVMAHGLPYKLGLIIAVIGGTTAASLAEWLSTSASPVKPSPFEAQE